MSTCYIACKYCGGEIGSTQAMTILKEAGEGVVEACHPDCQRVKMKCLSVRQPWANAIFIAGKDVENRSRYTDYRGPLLIHASRRIDWQAARQEGPLKKRLQYVTDRRMETGVIIGVVDLTNVVDNAPSEWAEPGCWHWLLANRRFLAQPFPCPGKLGLFEIEIPLGALIRAQTPNPEGENL